MDNNVLVLNVSFEQNSSQYSGILNHLSTFSNNVGIPMMSDQSMYENAYTNVQFYNKHTNKSLHFRDLYNILIGAHESEDPREFIPKKLDRFVDMDGVPWRQSKYKLFLPRSVPYKPFRESDYTLINANYTSANYMALMEHVNNYKSWVLEPFDHTMSLETVDKAINEDIEDGFIDLRESANYCQSVIEYFIARSHKKVDLETAMNYFIGKPVALLRLAATDGIHYAMENGYEEFKEMVLDGYTNDIQHKQNTTSIRMKTLMLPIRDLSQIAYEKLCSGCEIDVNHERFFQWHDWMFEGNKFVEEESVEALANIISKTMTGKGFDKNSWNMGMSVILDVALKEKQNIDNGLQTYTLYQC